MRHPMTMDLSGSAREGAHVSVPGLLYSKMNGFLSLRVLPLPPNVRYVLNDSSSGQNEAR